MKRTLAIQSDQKFKKRSSLKVPKLLKNREFLVLNNKLIFVGDTVQGLVSGHWVNLCIKYIKKFFVRGVLSDDTEIIFKFSEIQLLDETKTSTFSTNKALLSVNALLGLNSIKLFFQDTYDSMLITKKQGIGFDHFNLNLQLIGNPGLELAKVAQSYAALLKEMGVLPSGSSICEYSGTTLSNQTESLQLPSSGVIIISDVGDLVDDDESYVLDMVVNSFNPAIYPHIKKLVWILIGDSKSMNKCMSHSPVLHANFPTKVVCDDLSDRELEGVFRGYMENTANNIVINNNIATDNTDGDNSTDSSDSSDSSSSDSENECVICACKKRREKMEAQKVTIEKQALMALNLSKQALYMVLVKNIPTCVNTLCHEFTLIDLAINEHFGSFSLQEAPHFNLSEHISKFDTKQQAIDRFNQMISEKLSQGWSVYKHDINSNKSDTIDSWGNIWKWHMTAQKWIDPYGAWSTLPTLHNIGTTENPIVTSQPNSDVHIAWVYDFEEHLFCSTDNPDNILLHYPNVDHNIAESRKKFRIAPCDVKYLRIALSRLRRGKDGFSNADSVKKLFFTVLKRQADRLAKEIVCNSSVQPGLHPALTNDMPLDPLFLLTKADLLGPSRAVESVFKTSVAWKELLSMEGLHEVKASLRQLMELCVENANREDKGEPVLQVALNRIFLGNPGTGKTTVAKLYARILADLGLLSKGEVIYKTPSDFKGKYVGDSEAQTKAILDSAMGNVLVIDEAYGLFPVKDGVVTGDCYNEAIITTIVEQVMGTPGEDRAVVMLGYHEEMEQMLTYANPGLARRFQMDNALVFSDFDDSALQRILLTAVQKDQLVISEETVVHAIKQLAKAKALPHFGNAGAVNNLYSDAKLKFQTRQRALPENKRSKELLGVDFTRPLTTQTEEELFADLVGCDAVREKLQQIQRTMAFATRKQRVGKSDPKKMCEFNYVFTGNPGTGKTTVARLMGKMFCKLGLIPCEDVVEVSASDLITGYVGQAGKKTRDMLTKARGKVLFIDEAYQLNPKHGGHYMQEVVDELVKSLTSEEFKGKLVVILAGYEQSVEEMLRANPGLKSRFPTKIRFVDFTAETVLTILLKCFADEELKLDDRAVTDLRIISEKLVKVSKFANGRDLQTYFKHVYSVVAARYSENNCGSDIICDCEELVTVTVQDLYTAFDAFLANN